MGFVKTSSFLYNRPMNKKFYVTTPIYYVNDVPHIGHICTTVAADVFARYHRLLGEEVFFLTGTDEHGAKIAEAAAKAGKNPQEFCDDIAPKFKDNWAKTNLSFDAFIRTTDPKHIQVVQEVINKVYEKGDIYKGTYEGWYCVGCEAFKTGDELVNEECVTHNRPAVWQKEENYFFKLAKYAPALIKAIEDETDPAHYRIEPISKRNEILSKLKQGVTDLSISRANVPWGIAIPWDPTQTIYVWFDALINYYSATRIFGKEEFWGQAYHIVGKDIQWFHCVIWEAMLQSAGVLPPKEIFVHSFFMVDGQKMSKSLGNVISPQQLLEKFGVDGTRYLILANFPRNDDSDIGLKRFTEKYNSDLANNLGNLFSRFTKLSEQAELNGPSSFPSFSEVISKPKRELLKNSYENLDFSRVTEEINNSVNEINRDLQEAKPWEKSVIEKKQALEKLLPKLVEVAVAIEPLLPDTATKVQEGLQGKITAQPPIFPRVSL